MPNSPTLQKKMNRWISRFDDKSADVRKEAVSVMITVANDNTELRTTALNALAKHLSKLISERKADDLELYLCIREIENLEGTILFEDSELWNSYRNTSMTDGDVAHSVMRKLWSHIERDMTPPTNKVAISIASFAQSALNITPTSGSRDGRRDALKISDWAEDNGL